MTATPTAPQPSLRSPWSATKTPIAAATPQTSKGQRAERAMIGGRAIQSPNAARKNAAQPTYFGAAARRSSPERRRSRSRGASRLRSCRGRPADLLPDLPQLEEEQVCPDEEQHEPLDDGREVPGQPRVDDVRDRRVPRRRALRQRAEEQAASTIPTAELRPSSATAIPMKPIWTIWMSSTPSRNCQPRMSIAPASPAKKPEIAIAMM